MADQQQGGFASFFSDPEKLGKVSRFLSSFGQGVTAANEAGMSPFASVAFGFGQGGQGLSEFQEAERERELQELRAAKAKADLEETKRKREAVLGLKRFTTPSPRRGARSQFEQALDDDPTQSEALQALRPFIVDPATRQSAAALAGTFPKAGTPEGRSRIVSADDPENEQFNLGIPDGERARVEFKVDPTTGQPVADVKSRFGAGIQQDISLNLEGLSKREQVKKVSDFAKELREQKQAAVQSVRLGNRIASSLEKAGSGAVGIVGTLARFGNTLDEQVKSAARASGVSIDPEKYNFDRWPTEAIESSKTRSNILSLAYALARSEGQTGRGLSDQDVQRMLDRIGARSGSKDQILAALGEVTNNAIQTVDDAIVLNQDQFQGVPMNTPRPLSEDLERLGLKPLPRVGTQGAAPPSLPEGVPPAAVLEQAREAIRQGKDPDAVRERLRQFGIDPGNL